MNKLVVLVLMILIFSCRSETETPDKPVVSVSILPQKYFIERIAGNRVEVNVLIPPGASPATYEPSFSQITSLEESSLYLRIGHIGFELSWMEKIGSVNPDMKIADLSRGIDPINEEDDQDHSHLHGHAHGGIDPHIWLSAINARIISRNIFNELILILPEEVDLLSANYHQLDRELDSLHRRLKDMLYDQSERSFMIYHPALTYFARDYNLEQHALEIGGKEPSPAHMKWMTDLGREKKISTIFLQEQFDRKNAEALAAEIDAKIVLINPLDQEWSKQMLYIANMLNRTP